jgi:hypothetical protein
VLDVWQWALLRLGNGIRGKDKSFPRQVASIVIQCFPQIIIHASSITPYLFESIDVYIVQAFGTKLAFS